MFQKFLDTFGPNFGKGAFCTGDKNYYKKNGKKYECGTPKFLTYLNLAACNAVPGGTHRHDDCVTQDGFAHFLIRLGMRVCGCGLRDNFTRERQELAMDHIADLYLPRLTKDERLALITTWKGTIVTTMKHGVIFNKQTLMSLLDLNEGHREPDLCIPIWNWVTAVTYSMYHNVSADGIFVVPYEFPKQVTRIKAALVSYTKKKGKITLFYVFFNYIKKNADCKKRL